VCTDLCLLTAWRRKRPRLDGDTEADDVNVKTEPFIPGLDLVDEADISAVKEEDILDTGAVLRHFLMILLINTLFKWQFTL